VIQSVSLVVITLLFGFFTIGGGLIYAYLIGGACLCIFSFWQIRKAEINFNSFNFLLIKEQLVNYKNYPIYNAVPSLLNAASSALPVFFVVNYFSSNESGQFAFVKQNITVPIMYLAALISQVYFADIAHDIKENKPIKTKLTNLFKILAVFSFIISITLGLFGEEIFEFVFGSNWILAGKVAGIIVLSIAVQLIVSPLSITLIALDKIKILSIWQLSYFLAIAMLYFFRKLVFTDFLTLTTIMEVIALIVYSYLIMREVNNYEKRLYLPIT
jgi:O-antigen/teichoic acid export membrane protein